MVDYLRETASWSGNNLCSELLYPSILSILLCGLARGFSLVSHFYLSNCLWRWVVANNRWVLVGSRHWSIHLIAMLAACWSLLF